MAHREESTQEKIEASRATYTDHKKKFEQWKIDNSKQKGTESYENYVNQFHDWEKEMVKTIQRLQNSLDSANVDVALSKLLDEASRQQFTEALLQVYQMDKTFTTNVMANLKRILEGNVPVARPVAPTHMMSVPANYAQQSVSAWPQVAAVKFRAPSPVSSYKKPGGSMPFADFSK